MKIVLISIGVAFAIVLIAIIATWLLAFIMGVLDVLRFGDFMQDLINQADDLGGLCGEKIDRIVRRDRYED